MPSGALDSIDTLVVVVMENRSFDHMLGYLSLKQFGGRREVDGLRDDPEWLDAVANLNPFDGRRYRPSPLAFLQTPDQPHERVNIAQQLGAKLADGSYAMDGFIASAGGNSQVMQYYTPRELPVSDFFARHFAMCDRWFAPLPAGTQPNRLMTMSGYTLIDTNQHELESQELVYDWLTRRHIRWRVYHEGIPFFALMPHVWPDIASDKFRRFEQLAADVREEPDATFPQVIFIEPTYTDAPHWGFPSDDHPPASVAWGQAFLSKVYLAFATSKRWQRSALIVTYDEHGGFFDHVSPIALKTTPPQGASYPAFECSGVRVPGMVISPYINSGGVCHETLDNTSILKLLGDKFAGRSYSPTVDARPVGSLSAVFDRTTPRTDIPSPPLPSAIPPSGSVNVVAMHNAAARMQQESPGAADKFPELVHALARRWF
jgi:phospholipase C